MDNGKSYLFFNKTDTGVLFFCVKWLFLASLAGIFTGTASAWFLFALEFVTNYRENNLWIISLLPLAGIAIVLAYKYAGKNSIKGNNLIVENIQEHKEKIPFVMTPLIFLGTVITHLFGGSAGREGSAVQMGGSIAYQFSELFKLNEEDRKLILICGISAGFAAVFGTPLAGSIFAIEVIFIGVLLFHAIIPSIIAAFVANYVCGLWSVAHSHYVIDFVPNFSVITLLLAVTAGICFGLTGRLFSVTLHKTGDFFKKFVRNDILKPVVGSVIIIGFLLIWGNTDFIGLGLPTIADSFETQQPYYSFILKILLTAVTLSSGFKGGEVTPLFFIGATLGSFLSGIISLPVGLLAGMGFVAVFASATNTPLACILMGVELFGTDAVVYIAIACITANLCSGYKGIYSAQKTGLAKHRFWIKNL